jgi:ribonuclease VapC
MAYVFDTSVLIAIIKEEKGYQKGLDFLHDKVFMNTVNLAEFFAWVILHSDISNKEMTIFIQDLEIKVVDFDIKMAEKSSRLIPETKQYGLSLGDRACLSLGQKLNLPVITCDKVWSEAKLDCEIVVLR